MTASERLLAFWAMVTNHFSTVTPSELVMNLVLSVAAVALALLTLRLGRRGFVAAARRVPGRATADKKVRMGRVIRLLTRAMRVLVALVLVVVLADIWGISLLLWLSTVAGEAMMSSLGRLLLVAAAAVGAFELAGYAVGHGIGRLARRASDRRRRAQLQTLGPLLQTLAQSAILAIAVMMGLSELGVKIGPLLAGAGVVGIAVGFGAQTVVKDVVTGMFLIVEDIVSVGDIVRIGSSGGLVERMTLRTIRLRDFDGTLHVFPYGEAQVVHNLTKTFSYAVFDLQISYGSNIDRALTLMRRIGDEMRDDPAFAERILEPIEVVGVDNLADSGVVLKARVKTKPLEQWTVGREYNRRIKLAFDDAGVEIPFPHMKVVLPQAQLRELVAH